MNHDTLSTVESLRKLFFSLLKETDGFAQFESDAMELSFSLMSSAMSQALCSYDDWLKDNRRPPGCTIHDRRERTLLTECGQVSFLRRSYTTAQGESFSLLDETLGIKPYTRISPGAFNLVIKDVMCDSYERAAELLCRHSRTSLSRQSVKKMIRKAALPIQETDSEIAHNIFSLGIAPDAKKVCKTLMVEADGTWVKLQHEDKSGMEVKVFSAYSDKVTCGKKTHRVGVVSFASTERSDTFWKQSVARTACAYDLSSIDIIHAGSDGAPWCKKAEDYFKSSTVVNHLDPWHLKKNIYLALEQDDAHDCYWMCQQNRLSDALSIIDKYPKDDKKVKELRSYIKNNADMIGVTGPSLGTIECDNATIFKSRLAGRRAWSKESLSAMCALLSLKASKDSLSLPLPQAKHKLEVFAEKSPLPASNVLQSIGSGYEPPSGHIHQKGTDDWRFIKWAVDGVEY